MIFWFVASGLIALALAFVLPPFFRKSSSVSQQNVSSRDLNIAIYQERLDELKQLNLSETDFAKAKTELDKTLLEDIQTEQTISPQTQSKGYWAAIIVGILLPISAIGMFWKTGHFSVLETIQKIPSQTAQQSELNSLEEMIGRLEEKMKKNPDDPKGWSMLGRSYAVLERYAEAEQAYSKAVILTKESDPDVLADYAEAIALKNDGQIAGKPLELIQKNLNNFPDHPKSLWLIGLNAAQQGNFKEAVQNWEKVLAQMPPNSEASEAMKNHIQEVKKAGNLPLETTDQPVISNSTVKLNVQVELDPTLQTQIQPEQTVFIYAHPAQNKMPLAMVTKTAKELPLNITLDDSQAMLPTAKLSQYQEVIISARISKTGNAAPQSGDIFGETTVIKTNEVSQPIKIIINQVVP